MWRCGFVEMWMLEDVDMEIVRFGVTEATKLCLWLVEALRYQTKKLSVKRKPLYSLLLL